MSKERVAKAINARKLNALDLETNRRRFLKFVGTTPVGSMGCFLWEGVSYNAGGYGAFWLYGRRMGAHRAAYILFNNGGVEIDDDLVVRHKCNERQCVNALHLEIGTQKENMADRLAAGRNPRGTRNGQAKLTEEEVLAIRSEYIPGRRGELARLADKYQVSMPTIQSAIVGRNWKHLIDQMPLGAMPSDDPARTYAASGSKHHNSKVNEEIVRTIRKRYEAGETCKLIGESFGLKEAQTWAIATKRAWRSVE